MKQVETKIEIGANPEAVWAVLSEFERWPEWNRLMPAIEGPLVEGERVELELALPGRRSVYQKPRITCISPNRELRWYDQVILPQIFSSEHWFRLEPKGSKCVVRHGERFDGLLSIFMGRKTLDQTRQVFALMNRDLKERVEGLA